MTPCDHRSVGAIITDTNGRVLLLDRAKPPAGKAPVAGHIDDHGSPEQAVRAEAREEAGLRLLGLTKVAAGPLPNACRRPPSHAWHDGHSWTIYKATADPGESPQFSVDETRGGGWYTLEQLQELADRTVAAVRDGGAGPIGLEPVWVHWLAELGYIQVSLADLRRVWHQFSQAPDIP
jgi:ADP-ribose pyrophosphatase YjhB (NUDIX family)